MSDEKSFVFQIIFPCIQCAIFSSEFQYFPLSLVFISLTVILSVFSFFFFLELTSFGDSWTSQTVCLCLLSDLRNTFLSIISSDTFFLSSLSPFFPGTPTTHMLAFLKLFYKLSMSVSLFCHFFFFPFLRLHYFHCPIFKFTESLCVSFP